jgi:hypothetical protein
MIGMMNDMKVFFLQIAEREEEFGDLAVYEFIMNEIMPNINSSTPKALADKFYNFYDKRRMGE